MERAVRRHRLDAGMKGWIVNTAKKNYWRVPTYYQLEDLIQDGYVVYAYCNKKYRSVVPIQHFMGLVKISYVNHIHDLANERTSLGNEMLVEPDSYMLNKVEPSEALFMTLMRQLPEELRNLIMLLFTNAPPMLKRADGTRETTNEFFCRLLNIDPKLVNIMTVFKEHLVA